MNRRNQSAAVRFGPVLIVLMICFTVGGAGVGYVWQKKSIEKLAGQQKECERKLDALQKRNQDLVASYTRHISPAELERRVRELGLGLVKPEPEQIQVLMEPEFGQPYRFLPEQLPGSNPGKTQTGDASMIALRNSRR